MDEEKKDVPNSDPPPAYSAAGAYAGAPQYAPQTYPAASAPGYPPAQPAGYAPGYPPPAGYAPGQVVYQQPMITTRPVYQHDLPNDPFIYSIIVTVCCCWPIGIFAIMRASEARSAAARGDMPAATSLAERARCLSHAALGVGIGTIAVIVTFVVVFNVVIGRAFSNHGFS